MADCLFCKIAAGQIPSVKLYEDDTVPGLTQTMSLVGKNLTSVSVAITASLTAFATPTSGSAMLQLTGADVKVDGGLTAGLAVVLPEDAK